MSTDMQDARTKASGSGTKEYVVRVPKNSRRKYNMMRFHSALAVDFKSWSHVKMERENNMKEFKTQDDEMPKFGAGSEFGREQREEARRKKYGINIKKYRPDDQPWLMQVGGRTGKKFRGIREGGSENSSWYVFTQAKDGAFEAYPVEEWYNFRPIQRYKALSAEEAEAEFEKRHEIMNHYHLMAQKRRKAGDDDDVDNEEKGKKKASSKSSSFLLSEMDDWMSEEDSDDDENEDNDEDETFSKKKRKNKVQSKGRKMQGGKKKKKNHEDESDSDCLEESDEFDDGAEHDYISSDSSDSEAENDEVVIKELAGVDETDALKKLINSEDEDEEKKEEEEKKKEEEEKKEDEKEEKEKKKKKKKKKDKKAEAESDGKSSDTSEDEAKKKKGKGKESNSSSASNSRATTPTKGEGGSKRKNEDSSVSTNKKPRVDKSISSSGGNDSGVTEEAIRRYLMRKPMTTTELLQKFKSKKTGLNSEQLVHAIAQILKRINLVKQMVKGKMYLSLKT
ncbi:transcription factor IIFalpha isoform X2 [Oratosquilla oratoria]|uniref:transcription factor IIFalpha isoform X2 n=1 Tax=Oratosquilla oratoria TaxID=337810 RepID=UPI003F76755E